MTTGDLFNNRFHEVTTAIIPDVNMAVRLTRAPPLALELIRATRSQSFINHARESAKRGTCNRARVGVVIVKDDHIVVEGYNGALSKEPHCDDVGHLMENDHCIRSNHAEANAVAFAAKYGISLNNGTVYVTHYPCWNCFKLLVGAGVTAIYFDVWYNPSSLINEVAKHRGIIVNHWSTGPM